MRFLIADLKRGLTEKAFWAAIVLGSLCLIVSFLVVYENGQVLEVDDLFKQTQSLLLPFIAPLIAAMPYSNMNMLEKDCGFERLMLIKGKMKHYGLRRWLVVGIISGIALMLPVVLLALVCQITGAYTEPLFIAQVVGLTFCFGFAYGTIAYSLTFYNKKRYIPTITPQVIYLLFIYAFPYIGLEAYYPPLALSPWLLGGEMMVQNSVWQLIVLSVVGLIGVVIARLMSQMSTLGQKGMRR